MVKGGENQWRKRKSGRRRKKKRKNGSFYEIIMTSLLFLSLLSTIGF